MQLRALRLAGRVGPRTVVLANTSRVPPPGSWRSGVPLPSAAQVMGELSGRAFEAHFLDAAGLAEGAGAAASLNVVMLGALSTLDRCPVSAAGLLEAIHAVGAPRSWPANQRAFALGQAAVGAAGAAETRRTGQ